MWKCGFMDPNGSGDLEMSRMELEGPFVFKWSTKPL